MGECLIARGQTATKNVLDDIPVSGDYCSIVVLLQDSAGGPCENTKINCKDGTRWYNYTTNEAGMVLFKCNSGAANISANNWINGIYTFDQAAVNKDYDAPVGTKRLEKLNFGKINRFYQISGSYTGQFRSIDSISNLIVVGGGGGATGGYNQAGWGGPYGCGGGGGAKNYAAIVDIVRNQVYTISVGAGGSGIQGSGANPANSGGTSSAFGLSANGGSGASNGILGAGAKGLFNGGNGAVGSWAGNNHGKDGVNGAGGGGGGGTMNQNGIGHGGNNGGGNGASQVSGTSGIAGSGGGGGGGGQPYGYNKNATYGGSGGSGRIEFDM